MEKGVFFWGFMVAWLLFGFYWHWPTDPNQPRPIGVFGGNILLFILLGLLGWQVFGSAIK